MSQTFSVIKRNPTGEEIWQYRGTLLRRDAHSIVLEARFQQPDLQLMEIVLQTGDRFIETYYFDRWYNILEIHGRDDDRLKGWYCNIGKPAIMESDNAISYVDLALDLWVSPDGTQTILDKDEFAALDLDKNTRSRARTALEELQKWFSDNKNPDFA